MTVLKGEGRVSILYGSTRLPVGRNRAAYVARPDSAGQHPVVIVAAPAITSHVKAVCRRLARYGFSVICPDPGEDGGSGRAGIRDAVQTAAAPGTAWADGDRIALLGMGAGARAAAAAAPSIGRLHGMVLVAPPLDGPGEIPEVPAPALVVAAAGGGLADDARASAPGATWVVYRDAVPGFADETAPEYDAGAAEDCWRRVTEFFETHVGPLPAAGA